VFESLRAKAALSGRLSPPGDKSISHRALIFAALANGQSRIDGLLLSDDVMATRSALEQLGVSFSRDKDSLLVSGIGMTGLDKPADVLDMGNSGTAMRLLAGVLAAQDFDSELCGDESLSKRPMGRILKPLRAMGADIAATQAGTPPLKISGRRLQGIDYASPVASAQVKTCVLLAGLYAEGNTSVTEPSPSRDHTERMLAMFGIELGEHCSVTGGSQLQATEIRVPADISSAAFLLAAAAMVEDSEICLENVGLNPTRDGFLRALKLMGADVTWQNHSSTAEPAGDIRIRYNGRLKSIDLPPEWIPSMVDEVPVLMVLAATADGITRIRGAGELRVKESDRLSVMCAGLTQMGVRLKEFEDGADIEGCSVFPDAVLESAGDHRCAMSFAVMGLLAASGHRIRGAGYISTSYPGFVRDMNSLGATMMMNDLS